MQIFKSGFVNIIGNPNVGKSTLLNQLMNEKLVIVSPKAQTTRHRIKGILNGENYQIIFSDTPGVLEPKYKLQEKMMDSVDESLLDADVILYLVEPNEITLKNKEVADRLQKTEIPILLLINKIDTVQQAQLEKVVEFWHQKFPKANILPISALQNFNVDFIINKILSYLPEHPAFFPEDQLTDKSERFIVEEAIREKILGNYQKEIPYSVEIAVRQFKEEDKIIRIEAEIYVERDSQKGIIIGHKGESLKKVGTEARLDLQTFFQKKIFLQLFVKVKKDWRKNETDLKRFGY